MVGGGKKKSWSFPLPHQGPWGIMPGNRIKPLKPSHLRMTLLRKEEGLDALRSCRCRSRPRFTRRVWREKHDPQAQ